MVCPCVRALVCHSFALASFYADCPHKRIIYNESVQRQEQHTIGINTITLKNIQFM